MDPNNSTTEPPHRSLVLAAHGSDAESNMNRTVGKLAHRVSNLIQAQGPKGNFLRVTPAFLDGQPLMTEVLQTLPPGEVVVVPVMTSNGYYLKKFPELFQQNSNVDQFQITVSSVVGTHPRIPTLIAERVEIALIEHEIEASETTVVVVGHGTRRNPTSGDSTISLTKKVQQKLNEQTELTFETGFLDQDPELSEIVSRIKTRHTLVIPFLMGRGPHATTDIPVAFGLPSGPDVEFPLVRENEGGKCICDSPVGLYSELGEICVELADACVPQSPTSNPGSQMILPDIHSQASQSEGSLT